MTPGTMPPGYGRYFTVAKVANFCETSKSRRGAGVEPGLVRFKTTFLYKHRRPEGGDVKIIYDFL